MLASSHSDVDIPCNSPAFTRHFAIINETYFCLKAPTSGGTIKWI